MCTVNCARAAGACCERPSEALRFCPAFHCGPQRSPAENLLYELVVITTLFNCAPPRAPPACTADTPSRQASARRSSAAPICSRIQVPLLRIPFRFAAVWPCAQSCMQCRRQAGQRIIAASEAFAPRGRQARRPDGCGRAAAAAAGCATPPAAAPLHWAPAAIRQHPVETCTAGTAGAVLQ